MRTRSDPDQHAGLAGIIFGPDRDDISAGMQIRRHDQLAGSPPDLISPVKSVRKFMAVQVNLQMVIRRCMKLRSTGDTVELK
jgi:hypothetical protein